MKNRLIFPVAMVVLAAACGRDDGVAKGDRKSYDVVQEGSANGVTSTIQGPGETLPPLTGTNADTTTAFTIDPNAVPGAIPTDPAAASLAGSMPASSSYPPAGTAYPVPDSARPAEPSRTHSRPVTSPASRPQPESPPVERAQPKPQQTQPDPPPAAPPTVQPAPPPQQQPPPEREDEEADEEEPPPPTTTDTRGQ